jgi:eukaryotic-like serine/threonine-protein kinase
MLSNRRIARNRAESFDPPGSIPDRWKTTQEGAKRFLREAQAAGKLESEHVCRVHDVGTLETGSPYMVMEYMEGGGLGVLVREQCRPTPGVVVALLQAFEALAEAHALNIVHRDIRLLKAIDSLI